MSGCCRLADGQHLTEDAVKAIVGDLARPLTVMCSVADLQMVNISLRVLSKPDTHLLSQIFRSLGIDWDERVLPSIGNEILKAVVAQYNAEQLLTQRDRVSPCGEQTTSFRLAPPACQSGAQTLKFGTSGPHDMETPCMRSQVVTLPFQAPSSLL